ncbi:MAG: hypothetical protein R3F20_00680 [Planctomycetota bacterium]
MRPSLLPLLLALVACAFIALSCGDDPEAKTRPDESGSVSDRDRPESDDGPVRPAPSEGIGMADQLSDGVRPVAVQGPGTTADLSSSLQDGTGGGPPYAVPTKGFKAGARYLVRLEPQSTANAACQFMDAKTNVLSVVFTEGTDAKLEFRSTRRR